MKLVSDENSTGDVVILENLSKRPFTSRYTSIRLRSNEKSTGSWEMDSSGGGHIFSARLHYIKPICSFTGTRYKSPEREKLGRKDTCRKFSYSTYTVFHESREHKDKLLKMSF